MNATKNLPTLIGHNLLTVLLTQPFGELIGKLFGTFLQLLGSLTTSPGLLSLPNNDHPYPSNSFSFINSDKVKRLVVDLLTKLAESTDNTVDDEAVKFIERGLFGGPVA